MFFVSLTEWTWQNILIRILSSLILGSLIGIDRGAKRRGGGARTDAAVCLGATLVMLTAQYMDVTFSGSADISRMASQVISGVGFLGAGSILISGHRVRGLTSAASIWICACIGLAAGIGFVDGAALVTLVLLAGLHILPFIEEHIYHLSRYVTLYVQAEESRTAATLLHRLKQDGCNIDMYDLDRPRSSGQAFVILITVYIPWKINKEEYLDELAETNGVLSVDSL